MHGWGVAQRIQQLSKDVLQIGQGSLYPALYRLEYKGWIRSEWQMTENNRRAKYYRLTQTGKKQLATELASRNDGRRDHYGTRKAILIPSFLLFSGDCPLHFAHLSPPV